MYYTKSDTYIYLANLTVTQLYQFDYNSIVVFTYILLYFSYIDICKNYNRFIFQRKENPILHIKN